MNAERGLTNRIRLDDQTRKYRNVIIDWQPINRDSSDMSNFEPVRERTAIVAEGAGQRGIYTAGVMDAFLPSRFNPFEIAIGTSAGALNILTYVMGLPGYAKRAATDLSATRVFFALQMVGQAWDALSREGVPMGGDMLVDGSVADPIPAKKAFELGAKRILIVRTVPKHQAQSSCRQRIDALKLGKALPRTLKKMLVNHGCAYEETLKFIRNPPSGVEIVEIAPKVPLLSSMLGSHSSALMPDYSMGMEAGNSALEDICCWQSRRESLAA